MKKYFATFLFLVIGVVCIAILFGCKTKITVNDNQPIVYITSVTGEVEDVSIDSDNKVVSFTVENSIQEFNLNQLKFSVSEGFDLAVYSDESMSLSVNTIILSEGLNTYYVKIGFNDNVSVYTFKITRKESYHEHTFSNTWSYDDEYHWYAATCGHDLKSEYALHMWNNGEIVRESTEDVTGIIRYTCIVCGLTKIEDLPLQPHIHTYSTEWTYDANYHWHAATCGHADEISDKAVHDWDNGVVTLPATESMQGEKTYRCYCGATKKETIEKISHQHTYSSEWSANEEYHWHAATCVHADEIIDKQLHEWGDPIVKNATVYEPGTSTIVCKICNFKLVSEIAPSLESYKVRLGYLENDEFIILQEIRVGLDDDVIFTIPERKGYRFVEILEIQAEKIDTSTFKISNKTIKENVDNKSLNVLLNYEIRHYKVQFGYYDENDNFTLIENVSGYTFGYYDDNDQLVLIEDISEYNGDKEIITIPKTEPYTLIDAHLKVYNALFNDSEELVDVQEIEGDPLLVILPEVEQKEDYNFRWLDNSDGITFEIKLINAVIQSWEDSNGVKEYSTMPIYIALINKEIGDEFTILGDYIKIHTVNFYADDPSQNLFAEKRIEDGAKIGTVDIPQKDGYLFKNWYIKDNGKEIDIVDISNKIANEDLDLYARYVPTRKIEYIYKNENGESLVFTEVYELNTVLYLSKNVDDDINKLANNYTGRTLIGWNVNGEDYKFDVDNYPSSLTLTEDIAITALYVLNTYNVKFVIENKEINKTVKYGEIASLSNKDIPDYTIRWYNGAHEVFGFSGWQVDGIDEIVAGGYQIIDDTTLTAVFNARYDYPVVALVNDDDQYIRAILWMPVEYDLETLDMTIEVKNRDFEKYNSTGALDIDAMNIYWKNDYVKVAAFSWTCYGNKGKIETTIEGSEKGKKLGWRKEIACFKITDGNGSDMVTAITKCNISVLDKTNNDTSMILDPSIIYLNLSNNTVEMTNLQSQQDSTVDQ